ncbi:hypothetical protein G5I_13415 [Acromyrmex echinatior]|uniref:Uncharacterized protein n=1 Tax=Acromyrmex echinatior TaxID=103372 RepID=F4X4Z2_ACREC|nr:hypothetical protein G5I_13415 [Acromyrmex echinatior]
MSYREDQGQQTIGAALGGLPDSPSGAKRGSDTICRVVNGLIAAIFRDGLLRSVRVRLGSKTRCQYQFHQCDSMQNFIMIDDISSREMKCHPDSRHTCQNSSTFEIRTNSGKRVCASKLRAARCMLGYRVTYRR